MCFSAIVFNVKVVDTGRSLKDGKVEVVQRGTKASQYVAITEIVETIAT